MSLRPTNVPLTAKEFDTQRCGVCAGCGCACGYIAYLKDERLVDLYGHPHDPNGIGSLCTKGLTLIQEATQNPLRIREPLMRAGDDFRKVSLEEARSWIEENLRGRIGVFLDRLTDLRDYALARKLTDRVYSDSVYLPFKATTLRPQEWREQRVILSLECEPVFSEVMATRWLVDAFERSSYILSVSSRFETTSAKATERLLLKPPLIVRFFEELADRLEGREREYKFGEKVEKLARAFTLIKESLILIGETLLRTPWRGNVLDALRRIRRKVGVNYTIVGNLSPLPSGEVEDFRRDLEDLDVLILFGNPALYLSEEELKKLSRKKVLSFEVFPNLTAHHSDLVLPAPLFPEREFIGFRSGFGFLSYSPQVLERPRGVLLFGELFGREADISGYLSDLDVSMEDLVESEGGVDLNLPFVEEWEGELEKVEPEEEGLYLVCDSTLVDELGHWNVWTHEIERKQLAHLNERTAEAIGAGEEIEINGISLKVKINNNIADGVIFVPNSFEETQPFDPGVRVGKLLKEPHHRVERLSEA